MKKSGLREKKGRRLRRRELRRKKRKNEMKNGRRAKTTETIGITGIQETAANVRNETVFSETVEDLRGGITNPEGLREKIRKWKRFLKSRHPIKNRISRKIKIRNGINSQSWNGAERKMESRSQRVPWKRKYVPRSKASRRIHRNLK